MHIIVTENTLNNLIYSINICKKYKKKIVNRHCDQKYTKRTDRDKTLLSPNLKIYLSVNQRTGNNIIANRNSKVITVITRLL